MTIDTANTKAAVIRKTDKTFPDWLDFTALRNEGLRHIGAFSGKLWTDHNLHDPGITTLEVLSYALLDLGYRTSRPIENLLAPIKEGDDDNFFTANQILTNNPLTPTDYRKLLLSLPEVRNAWLVVSDKSTLATQDKNKNLIINGLYKIIIEPNFDWVHTDHNAVTDGKTDPSVFNLKISPTDLVKKVNKLLNAHRNLCEDFEPFAIEGISETIGESKILHADKLSLSGRILLHPNADAARVYTVIYRAIADFIAPTPHFYTLQQMLDKGKTIEEIYEGRPSTVNTGFIDTDELAAIRPRTEIHLSDLYNLVAQIEGVQSVQLLQLTKRATATNPKETTESWCYTIPEGSTPILQDLELDLTQGVTTVQRTLRDLSNSERQGNLEPNGTLAAEPLPYGLPLTDLGDYYSIQRDFPRVYRIGDGGLSSKATDIEKAQVRQFKGYLLFFERILTDYLAQLTHVRDLFSMTSDSQRTAEQKHSYFAGSLDNVPDVDTLLRFANSAAGEATLTATLAIPTEGGILNAAFDAIMVTNQIKPIEKRAMNLNDALLDIDFLQFFAELEIKEEIKIGGKNLKPQPYKSVFERDAVLTLLRQNLENEQFKTVVYEDAAGFFFTIQPSAGGTVLLSRVHYSTRKEAQETAALTALVGSMNTGFRLVNLPNNLGGEDGKTSEPIFTFDVVSSPAENLEILSQSLENSVQYAQRRNILLDHLLARFAEQFTDYATLMYQVFKGKSEDKARTAQDKAQFLENYDNLSQNRARAYNYTEGRWLSENTSGFEQKLKALSGMRDARRRTLCPFVINECDDEYNVKITDATGRILLETNEAYPKDVAKGIVQSFTEGVFISDESGQSADNFRMFSTPSNDCGFGFQTPRALLTHPKMYASESERDAEKDAIYAVFRQKHEENEIFTHTTKWQIGLYAAKLLTDLSFEARIDLAKVESDTPKKQRIQVGKEPYETADAALNASPNFIKNLEQEAGLILHADPQQAGVFINTDAFEPIIATLPTVFRWHIVENTVIKKIESVTKEIGTAEFLDESAALADFIATKTMGGVTVCGNICVFEAKEAHQWSVIIGKEILLNSAALYPDQQKAQSMGRTARELCKDAQFFKIMDVADGSVTLQLHNEAAAIVASAPNSFANAATALAAQERIIAWANEKGTRAKAVRFALKSYNFDILDEKNTPILRGYTVCENRELALQKAFDVLQLTSQSDAFYKSGDEANPDYTFLLRDKENRTFAAQYPYVFETAKERETAVKTVQKLLKNTQKPLFIKAEPPRYAWTLTGVVATKGKMPLQETEVNAAAVGVLKSFSYFDSPENALADFKNTLHIAGQTAQYKIRSTVQSTVPPKTNYFFDIYHNAAPCATAASPFDALESVGKAIGQLVQRISNNRFIVQTQEYRDRFKFQYFALKTDTMPLFVSENDFGSPEEAAVGFADFVKDWHTKDLKDNNLLSKDGKKIAQLVNSSGASKAFIQNVKHLRNREGLIKSAVQKSARSEQGRWVYRLLDTNTPLAYAMVDGGIYSEKKEEAAKGKLIELSKNKSQICPVLTFCLDGDNLLEIGNQWHYVLKVHDVLNGSKPKIDTILWISVAGFDTKALAQAAFQQNYVADLQAAMNPDNYVKDLATTTNSKGEYPKDGLVLYKNRVSTEGYPNLIDEHNRRSKCRVFVPFETITQYSIEELAAFAQSYPLREDKPKRIDSAGNTKKQYSFVLYDCKTQRLAWKSAASFDTTEGALMAWRRFYTMLNVDGSCRVSMTNNCGFTIAIFEILLESKKRYGSSDLAWNDVKLLTNSATKTDALYLNQDKKGLNWSFSAVSECFRLATSPLRFSSDKECKAFLKELIDSTSVLSFKPDIEIPRKMGQIVIFNKKSKDKPPTPCGCPKKDSFDVEESVMVLNFLEGTEKCLPLEKDALTAYLKDKDNYRIVQADAHAAYTFELVNEAEILAEHCVQYPTQSEAAATLQRADDCLNTEGVHLIEKILLRPRTPDTCRQYADSTCELPYLEVKDVCPPPKLVNGKQQPLPTYIPNADPFSFIVKVIMPSWGKRFGTANFRKELERLFAHEAPAHILLDIDYKDPRDLCVFEKDYRNWLCGFKENPKMFSNLLKDCPDNNINVSVTDVASNSSVEVSEVVVTDSILMDNSVVAITDVVSTKATTDTLETATEAVETTESTPKVESVATTPTPLFLPIDNKENRLEKSVEATSVSKAKTAKTKANDQFIRQRLGKYAETVQGMNGAKLLKTESYKQTLFFLQSDGNARALDMLVDLITRKSLNKKGGATDAAYTILLHNAVCYALDKWVVATPDAVQNTEILRGIVEKMKRQGVDIQRLVEEWNGEEWIKPIGAIVIEEYKNMFSI